MATINGNGTTVSTFVAGFNAHRQLDSTHTNDINSFEKRLEVLASTPNSGRVVFAGWSITVLRGAGAAASLFSLGHQTIETSACVGSERLRCAVGDHDGVKAALNDEGQLYVAETSRSPITRLLQCSSPETSPLLSHIALAQNGRVAVTFKQAPNGRLCHIVEFVSIDRFLRWFNDPSAEGNYPEGHHMLPGRPKQLLANTATFVILMDGGEVYTWGDARYQSLGRAITGDSVPTSDKPGAVGALGGIKIAKVACGGWMSAALSEDAALYIWGSNTPGGTGTIRGLRDTDSSEVNLVCLPDSHSEPLDVLDVAIGDDHIAVLAEGHRVFLAGNNKNGQLGLESDQEFFEDWQELQRPDISHPSGVHGVDAGPKSTFLYVVSE